ncbi:MAG: hypothetical protein SGARI_007354 [Bacillariaceae sp.]
MLAFALASFGCPDAANHCSIYTHTSRFRIPCRPISIMDVPKYVQFWGRFGHRFGKGNMPATAVEAPFRWVVRQDNVSIRGNTCYLLIFAVVVGVERRSVDHQPVHCHGFVRKHSK